MISIPPKVRLKVVGRLWISRFATATLRAGAASGGPGPIAMRQPRDHCKTGNNVLNQPELPVPLVMEFPFPAWATRPREAGPGVVPTDGPAALRAAKEPDDPFDGLG